jgi:uncharacterized protein YegJ (DUF2314 family)
MKQFKEYNLPDTDPSWSYLKNNHMVKITYMEDGGMNESFWVWIKNIDNDIISGLICNDLLTNNLKIGQTVKFKRNNIKELSSRNYTYAETKKSINNTKMTQLLNLLNIKIT